MEAKKELCMIRNHAKQRRNHERNKKADQRKHTKPKIKQTLSSASSRQPQMYSLNDWLFCCLEVSSLVVPIVIHTTHTHTHQIGRIKVNATNLGWETRNSQYSRKNSSEWSISICMAIYRSHYVNLMCPIVDLMLIHSPFDGSIGMFFPVRSAQSICTRIHYPHHPGPDQTANVRSLSARACASRTHYLRLCLSHDSIDW